MKIEAVCGSDIYTVEVQDGPAEGEVTVILRSDEEDVCTCSLTVLSVDGERWVLARDGKVHDLLIREAGDSILVESQHDRWSVAIASLKDRRRSASQAPSTEGMLTVQAQMPGKVVRILKTAGEAVRIGEGVVIIEAMKMQNEIRSPGQGTIVACPLEEGQSVQSGDILFEVE